MKSNRINLHSIAFSCVALLACTFGWSTFAIAQTTIPTLKPLGLWDNADDIIAECQKNWDDAAKEIDGYEKAIEAKDASKIDTRNLGKTYAKIMNVARDATALEQMGEPASVDFQYRATAAAAIVENTAKFARRDKGTEKLIKQAQAYKSKTDSKRQKGIQKISELLAQSKFEEAEEMFRDELTDADSFVLWLSPSQAKQMFSMRGDVSKRLRSEMPKIRQPKTVELAIAAINKHQLDLTALVSAASTAASEIGSSGTTTIDGETCDGPLAISKLCQQWRITHTKLLNNMGVKFAAGRLGDSVIYPDDAEEEADELAEGMQKQFVQIIAADAKATSADQVANKYARYVQAIGGFADLTSLKTLVPECEKALAEFAKKDTAFNQRVINYQNATNDLLKWRSRAASSAAKSMEAKYAEPASLLGKQRCIPKLGAGLNLVVPELAEHAGKSVRVQKIFGMSEKASFSAVENNVWAGLKGDLYQQAQVEGLMQDLLISDQQPPLSIVAAAAVLTAQNNVFESAGGTINSFIPESTCTRLAKLPAALSTLYPIGSVPEDDGLSSMLLRMDLKPEWIQHKYFFVKLK